MKLKITFVVSKKGKVYPKYIPQSKQKNMFHKGKYKKIPIFEFLCNKHCLFWVNYVLFSFSIDVDPIVKRGCHLSRLYGNFFNESVNKF